MPSPLYTLYFVHCTLHCIHNFVYFVPYTLYCIQCIVYIILYALYCIHSSIYIVMGGGGKYINIYVNVYVYFGFSCSGIH